MTKPTKRRDLTDAETELVRMVAQGNTDAQIADILGVKVGTVRCRVNAVYHRLGIAVGNCGTPGMTRLLLVIWAYESGIVGTPAPVTRDQKLVDDAFAVCGGLVYKRPYPLLREQAVKVIRVADAGLIADEKAAA
jgi:hypothetical protein